MIEVFAPNLLEGSLVLIGATGFFLLSWQALRQIDR